jgi:hypothetical protein
MTAALNGRTQPTLAQNWDSAGLLRAPAPPLPAPPLYIKRRRTWIDRSRFGYGPFLPHPASDGAGASGSPRPSDNCGSGSDYWVSGKREPVG